jgi:ABC-type Fe3+/spermidine/putrescine transport system ATPase subunit
MDVCSDVVKVAINEFSESPPVSIPLTAWHNAAHCGQDVVLAIRPEKIRLWSSAPEGKNFLSTTLEAINFLGDRYEYTVKVGSENRVVVLPALETYHAGSKIFLELRPEGISLWPKV